MGLFDKLKKETYINRLVMPYRTVYGCGDYAAIECLRRGYTLAELKSILDALALSEERGSFDLDLETSPPFKESFAFVERVNAITGGK